MAEPEAPPPALDAPRAEPTGRRISAVWLVPLIALVVALVLAWRVYDERGPLIEIVFDDASGLVAGQTPLRFRDVTVGMVEKIELSPNLRQVVVSARIHKDVAHFLDADAQFWIVRASITPQGISGLDTVLSGSYIGASWDDTIGPAQSQFHGLTRPPLTPAGTPGLRVRLRAPDGGSMTIGAPVLFKRIQVGKIEDIELTEAGDVMLDLFVNAPNDAHLTEGTRFWNTSGFSVRIGGGGATLDVDSLISLLQGGVAFDTVGPDTERVAAGHVYQLYSSQIAARQNLIEESAANSLTLNVDFDQSVRGLDPGAAVQFEGIPVGEVIAVQGIVQESGGAVEFRQRVTIRIVPERFGQRMDGNEEKSREQALDFLEGRVKRGLRAQLAAQGLLAQTLYVQLVEIPDAPDARLDRTAKPYPILPSAPSRVGNVADSAEGFMTRVANLPIEQVVQNAVELLSNLNKLVTDDKVRSAPENLGLLIADLREMVSSSGIREAPAQVAAILASVKTVVDQAAEAQLVQNLSDVLGTTKSAIASVGTAADGVPQMLAQVEDLSAKVQSLPLDQLVAAATQLVNGLDDFVRSDKVAALPATVEASLADLRGVVADLRQGGAVDNLNATLASARQLSEQLAAARVADSLQTVLTEAQASVHQVGVAAHGLPKLIDSLTSLSEEARSLPLDKLVASGQQVLATADGFLRGPGVADIPPRLAAAIEELRVSLEALRTGGAVDNLNATLKSVRQMSDELVEARIAESLSQVVAEAKTASANVSSATSGLPALVDSLTALSEKARALPLDELVASLDATLGSAEALLASEGVTALPPKLTEAVESLRAILDEARTGGTVTRLNSTLASTDRAAAAVADDLPALIARFDEVASRADAALATVTPGGEINRQTVQLLQELRDAARSANSLASALERRPNSILFGR